MKIKYFEYICMYIPIVIVSMLLGVLACAITIHSLQNEVSFYMIQKIEKGD